MTALEPFPNRRIFTQQAKVPQPYSASHTTNGLTTLRGVWQDKPHPQRARIASPQPAPPKNEMRPHQLDTNPSRSQKLSKKRKTVHLSLWVKPSIKAELQRIAEQEGVSISATGAAFLETSLQQNLHTQHAALLDPIIDKAIGKHMRSYSSRIALLLVRVAFDSGQTRSLVTNILSRQSGVTPTMLTTILDGSSKAAKRNITHKTPQLQTMLTELEQFFTQHGEGEKR